LREVVAFFSYEKWGASYPHPLSQLAADAIAKKRAGQAPPAWASPFDIDLILDALDGVSRILDHKDGRTPALGRYFSIPRSRLKKFRERLFSEVAAEASQKFASKVSPRFVETAWEEQRNLANELKADESSLEHLVREP
jgi:hypothetical protein